MTYSYFIRHAIFGPPLYYDKTHLYEKELMRSLKKSDLKKTFVEAKTRRKFQNVWCYK